MQGITSDGKRTFASVEEMWAFVGVTRASDRSLDAAGRERWYARSGAYWAAQEPSVEGVLGGYGRITVADVRESATFLRRNFKRRGSEQCALDCGAGIGRTAEALLAPLFAHVDVAEADPAYCAAMNAELRPRLPQLRNVFQARLQDLVLEPASYDLVWVQWVIGYLYDEDLVHFFRVAAASLKPGGALCIKDNVSRSNEFILDLDDSSVARGEAYLRRIITAAGLTVCAHFVAANLPSELMPVHYFLLRPVNL